MNNLNLLGISSTELVPKESINEGKGLGNFLLDECNVLTAAATNPEAGTMTPAANVTKMDKPSQNGGVWQLKTWLKE